MELREKYTGVDKELADHYWSNKLHLKLFEETLDQLEVRILNGPFLRGGCAAVVVNCMSGEQFPTNSLDLKLANHFSM